MSKLVNCKACGKEVAKGVKRCPNCGKDQRSFFGKHKILTGILAVIILVAIGGILGGKDKGNDNAAGDGKSQQTSTNNPSKEGTKITYENFLKINMGDTYEDIVAILGEGEEDLTSETGGMKTVMYTWKGTGISAMNVTIMNDEVINKTQIGLKNLTADINMDKYNQVKEGMTYEEVKAILGEGEVTSHSEIMDVESAIYSWINKDASNMNCTFIGNKLELKAQFNLK